MLVLQKGHFTGWGSTQGSPAHLFPLVIVCVCVCTFLRLSLAHLVLPQPLLSGDYGHSMENLVRSVLSRASAGQAYRCAESHWFKAQAQG